MSHYEITVLIDAADDERAKAGAQAVRQAIKKAGMGDVVVLETHVAPLDLSLCDVSGSAAVEDPIQINLVRPYIPDADGEGLGDFFSRE